jgi:glutaredoxin-related protein
MDSRTTTPFKSTRGADDVPKCIFSRQIINLLFRRTNQGEYHTYKEFFKQLFAHNQALKMFLC